MTITQLDSRTVRVDTQGSVLSLPYSFFWNGHERQPESVVLEGSEVKAFFLFGTIKDRISEDAAGLSIHRTWSVMTPGTVRLAVRLEFALDGCSALFPGTLAAVKAPPERRSVLGEKTSLPSAVFLLGAEVGALVSSPLPVEGALDTSVGASSGTGEDGEPIVVVEVRAPAVEEPDSAVGPKPGDVEVPEPGELASPGTLEKTHTVRVLFGDRDEVVLRGTAAAVGMLPAARGPARRGPVGGPDESALAAVLGSCMASHLVQEGGVCGLRELPGSPYVSASAGATLAALLVRLHPDDDSLLETALRLADFCLKGQHPTGLFYDTYHLQTGEWQGVRGRRGGVPLLSTSHAAWIADMLIGLSRLLSARGVPGEKYWLAGTRFVDFFLDPRLGPAGSLHAPGERDPAERSVSGFEVLFPLSQVLEVTGHDRYGKAVDAIARELAAVPWDCALPPSSREARGPDSQAALSCGRAAALLLRLGRDPGRAELFLSLVAQWVHVNRPASARAVDPVGGITDSFARQRLLFAGAEAAYVLGALAPHCRDPQARETARALARLALGFSDRAPAGTAFFQHTRWDPSGRPSEATEGTLGPVDSRRLVREAHFRLALGEPRPAPRRRKPARKAKGRA